MSGTPTQFRARAHNLGALGSLQALGITLPQVDDAHKAWLTHLDRTPQGVGASDDLTAMWLGGATDQQIAAAAIECATYRLRHESHQDALGLLAAQVRKAIRANGTEIIQGLQPLAAPLIETANRTAALTSTDVATLIREGRVEDAQLAAGIGAVHARLRSLHQLQIASVCSQRDAATAFGDGGWRFDAWRNPQKAAEIALSPLTDPVGWMLAAIQQGASPWFPTAEQARQRARQWEAKHRQPA
jgi:hypothetical protein